MAVLIPFACAAHCTGDSSFEVKTDADSNDITEHPQCDKRFTRKDHLNRHKQSHTGDMMYSCTQCEKRFATQRYLRQHMNVHSSKYKCTECGKCFRSNQALTCLLYTSPSPRDRTRSRMPSSA